MAFSKKKRQKRGSKAKKAVRKKAVKKKAKKTVKKAVVKKGKKIAKKAPRVLESKEALIGKVTHYFPHVKAGAILIEKGTITLGDTIHIKGHTTDFKQKVKSLQINRAPIQTGKGGDEVGVLVKSRVRINDKVYKAKL